MKNTKNLKWLSIIFILMSYSSWSYANTLAQQEPAWSYTGERFWDQLDPSYQLCATGENQSPVNIKRATPKPGNLLKFHYTQVSVKPIQKTIIHKDHTLRLHFPQDLQEYLSLNRERYYLSQLHFHTPSENLLNNKAFPLEMHLIHQSSTGNLAIVAVLVKSGRENPALVSILKHLPPKENQLHTIKGMNLDLYQLLPSNKSFYSFKGSLTSPPCSEDVEWLVMAEPIEASMRQINKLKQVLAIENARSVQPLNARKVFYTPMSADAKLSA
jgi:carbonic anhydrase